MYSLRIRENALEAELEKNSGRARLWRNLRDKKKCARMVRRIYNKTSEEMVESRRSRCDAWVTRAAADTGKWVREPEPSVFDHTFRDRNPEAEVGPANGHISARKYIPRLAFSGGGELDKAKTADLRETFSIPSRMRGNDPSALQNPCRPTMIIEDTAKTRGRVEHPHWEAPRYFLRPREKAKEIGPDIQYADRNDMQRIFSGVVKNSLFPWGKYEGRGSYSTPTCRDENSDKWVGDKSFNPGYKFRDNQRETMAGVKFPKDLLNEDDYRRPRGFERQRYPEKELSQHGRFRLVIKNNEYACPEGITRRMLRYEEQPPEPYPERKTFFASLRSVPPSSSRQSHAGQTTLRTSASLGSLASMRGAGGGVGLSVENARVGREHRDGDQGRRADRHVDGPSDRSPNVSRPASSSPPRLSPSKSCASIRFSPDSQRRGNQAAGLLSEDGREERKGDEYLQKREEVERARSEALAAAEREAIIAGGMRRGSEVASWAVCGTTTSSSRDYLW